MIDPAALCQMTANEWMKLDRALDTFLLVSVLVWILLAKGDRDKRR